MGGAFLRVAQAFVIAFRHFHLGPVSGAVRQQFRDFDFRQQSAFFDLVAFVHRDSFQVTSDFGIEGGLLVGEHVAGQGDEAGDRAALQVRDPDLRRHNGLARFSTGLRLLATAEQTKPNGCKQTKDGRDNRSSAQELTQRLGTRSSRRFSRARLARAIGEDCTLCAELLECVQLAGANGCSHRLESGSRLLALQTLGTARRRACSEASRLAWSHFYFHSSCFESATALCASSGSSEAERRWARAWMMAKTDGNTSTVSTVAAANPPTTPRPSGAVCCPPSPRPRAIGVMPAIIPRLVIKMGRRRL